MSTLNRSLIRQSVCEAGIHTHLIIRVTDSDRRHSQTHTHTQTKTEQWYRLSARSTQEQKLLHGVGHQWHATSRSHPCYSAGTWKETSISIATSHHGTISPRIRRAGCWMTSHAARLIRVTVALSLMNTHTHTCLSLMRPTIPSEIRLCCSIIVQCLYFMYCSIYITITYTFMYYIIYITYSL